MTSRANHPPTTLYFIRHGEPEAEFHNCYYGQQDVPLSERGKAQSRTVAERLASVPFEAVYSSDLSRTCYLADLLAEPRGLPVRRLTVFRERHMGALQGISFEVLERDHSEVYNRWLGDRVHYRCPEAENFVDLHQRIVPAVEELVAAFAGRRIALVGHAGPIRVTLAHALGLPLENIFRLTINHCAINVIEYSASGAPRVSLING
jgi:broad specificity phosphatase PhoE